MGVVGRAGGAFVERRTSPVPLEARPRRSRIGDAYLACPRCRKWFWHLYADDAGEWACRKCLRLDYSSRHEIANDAAKAVLLLRKRLGAEDLRPFGALPERPPRGKAGREHDKLARELAILEMRAFNHLHRFVESFERLAKKGARP